MYIQSLNFQDSKAGDSKVDPKAFNKLEKSNELLKEKVESLKNAAKVKG